VALSDQTAIDPDTGQPWPVRFDTRGTARYLRIAHNLPVAELTLVRQRSKGQGEVSGAEAHC
jgi:hypothetical protein